VSPGDQWIRSGLSNRLNRQVDVEERPVQMVGGRPFYPDELFDRGTPKPWEVLERQKQLFSL